MNPYQREPSLFAVFFSELQRELLEKRKVSTPMIDSFLLKLGRVFKNPIIYSNFSFSETVEIQLIDEHNERNFLVRILDFLPQSESGDPDIDEVYFTYCEGIYPILDEDLTIELKERHKKYLSQYSYSENLPPGIVPSFLSREFLLSLPENLTGRVHEFLIKNINNYDTEIFYQAPDLRQFRLDFSLDSLRSVRFVQDVLSFHPELRYANLLDFIKKHPTVFRSFPSYIEFEIYKGCEYDCNFCPRTVFDLSVDHVGMELALFNRVLDELKQDFGSPVTLAFGGLGEPLLHPDFHAFLKTALSGKIVKELIIETALYTRVEEFVQTLGTVDQEILSKLTVIVNLPSHNKDSYQNLTNSKISLEKILENLGRIKKMIPKENLYVQMIKIKEVESEIEDFFNFFEREGYSVLLQKYNTFAGRMPEKRVSDLTPIQREFCWHLARDFYIQVNGDVLICRQLGGEVIGNIENDDIGVLWEKGMEYFSYSLIGEHGRIPAPCLKCDEWYTFNA